MAKVTIVLEDVENGILNYKSSCDTPNEVDENGEPALSIKLAVKFIEKIASLDKNQVK
jgi:hypothetical protein